MPPKNLFHRAVDGDYNERPVAFKLFNKTLENVDNTANVNPFTPDTGWWFEWNCWHIFNLLINVSFVDIVNKNKKRSRIVALHENNKNSPQVKSLKHRSVASLFSNHVVDEDEETGQQQAPKRLALQDTNISRYRREFVEIELIGKFSRQRQ